MLVVSVYDYPFSGKLPNCWRSIINDYNNISFSINSSLYMFNIEPIEFATSCVKSGSLKEIYV